MNPVINKIMEKPDLYSGVLIDMVQKLGFAAAMSIILVIFLCVLIVYMLTHVVEAYKTSIRYLNDQNKQYQDYFLQNRTSSDKKFLSEPTEKQG